MPAAKDHPAVREQVRLLYLGNGRNLTLAAKTVGIPVDRAEKWKERGKWDQAMDPAAQQLNAVSDSVGAIVDNLSSALKKRSDSIKKKLAEVAENASDELLKKKGNALLKQHQAFKNFVGGSGQLLGWDTSSQGGSISLNILTGQAAVQINSKPQE